MHIRIKTPFENAAKDMDLHLLRPRIWFPCFAVVVHAVHPERNALHGPQPVPPLWCDCVVSEDSHEISLTTGRASGTCGMVL